MRELFQRASEATAQTVGSAETFVAAVAIVVLWAATGPLFSYSDSWQLVINTGTTIVTFLMVFLIQATQNRDTRILNLKLDELLRALEGARTDLVNLDQLSDEE
ncbi:MAG: low affinity iron permease family protein, partial [Proteobacteria bacterium]|nr:low affinity iron permease family protein [Pseudomonadota bacterium]